VFEELIERIQYYKKLGLNPLALATGCAVKVDLLRVVYPAIRNLKEKLNRSRFAIAPREDALIISGDASEVHRRVYHLNSQAKIDLTDIRTVSRGRKLYAVTVVQIYQRYADTPEAFLDKIAPVYLKLAELNLPIYLGKGHSIITPFAEDEFILFDFLPESIGEGFTAVNNDTIHIVDPTQEPGDFRQVSGALSNALNDIFVLGVHRNLRVYPVINAPSEELIERLWSNIEIYSKKYDVGFERSSQLERGRLLMGATTIGYSDRAPPLFEDRVEIGSKLVITRPMGELAPINLFLSCIVDESIVKDIEELGIQLREVEKAKDEAVERISTPNIEAAQVIYKYLPYYREEFKPDEHISITTDVTGPGVLVVKELAERSNTTIKLYDVPLLFPQISELATKLYIIPNATSGTNGPFIIVAPDAIAHDVVKDLKAKGLNASIIGEVIGKGDSEVIAPAKLKKYIADHRILMEFKLV